MRESRGTVMGQNTAIESKIFWQIQLFRNDRIGLLFPRNSLMEDFGGYRSPQVYLLEFVAQSLLSAFWGPSACFPWKDTGSRKNLSSGRTKVVHIPSLVGVEKAFL